MLGGGGGFCKLAGGASVFVAGFMGGGGGLLGCATKVFAIGVGGATSLGCGFDCAATDGGATEGGGGTEGCGAGTTKGGGATGSGADEPRARDADEGDACRWAEGEANTDSGLIRCGAVESAVCLSGDARGGATEGGGEGCSGLLLFGAAAVVGFNGGEGLGCGASLPGGDGLCGVTPRGFGESEVDACAGDLMANGR